MYTPEPPFSPYLTPKQVAKIAQVRETTVTMWLRRGLLRGVKMGPRAWRIPQTALENFIADGSNGVV